MSVPGIAAMRRHWLFLLVLGTGVSLRVIAQVAYRPALLFVDSWNYLSNLTRLDPAQFDPIGYQAILLRPVLWVGNLATVAAAQHFLGLAMGLAIYVVLLHRNVRPGLAVLAAAPVLLDAYQVQIEHNIMSDTLFEVIVLAGVLVLIRARHLGSRACIGAGLLFGIAVSVRSVGAALVVPAALFVLLVTGPGARWRNIARLLAGFAAPLLLYGTYYSVVSGTVGLMGGASGALYGRAAAIVDCRTISLPAYERPLCPTVPLAKRSGDRYAHDPNLLARLNPPKGMTAAHVERDFARRVFEHQPADLVQAVAGDFFQGFTWAHTTSPTEVPVSRWQFQVQYPRFPPRDPVVEIAQHGGGGPAVAAPLARFLRGYQLSLGYVPGPLIAAGFLIGLLAPIFRRRGRRAELGPAALLAALSGLALLLGADFFEFSWRYRLPALIFAPLAAALGLSTVRERGAERHATGLDEADWASLAAFEANYDTESQAPVVVVIAAYNEAAGIAPVLDELPTRCCGLLVETLVVVDGATDETEAVAAAHGARVCRLPTNRGQGAALRLGYLLARRRGARFVVTTDADGQYDGTELHRLIEPLVSGTADLVTGSRWLGSQQTNDPLRRLGSWGFAWLATSLTGQPITDTSFGFRAMRAEVPARLALREPQYQSSELLLGAILAGYRIAERPLTQRARTHGRTKKGLAPVYGWNYARVLLGTWWRHRHPSGDATGPDHISLPIRTRGIAESARVATSSGRTPDT